MKLLGHPAHVAVIHLPMAGLLLAPACDLLALATGDARAWAGAAGCEVVTLVGGLLAATTGLLDLAKLPPEAERTGLRHAGAALLAVGVAGAALAARGGLAPPSGAALVAAVVLDVLAAGLAGLVGWLGGELVFRHGAGRNGPPPPAG